MNWLARMMYGRYGTDQLGFFTLLLMLILNMVFAFTGWDALYILSFALAILSIFRIFSKNVSKRYEENQKFLQMTAPTRASCSSHISSVGSSDGFLAISLSSALRWLSVRTARWRA